jgi:hypothetical protein
MSRKNRCVGDDSLSPMRALNLHNPNSQYLRVRQLQPEHTINDSHALASHAAQLQVPSSQFTPKQIQDESTHQPPHRGSNRVVPQRTHHATEDMRGLRAGATQCKSYIRNSQFVPCLHTAVHRLSSWPTVPLAPWRENQPRDCAEASTPDRQKYVTQNLAPHTSLECKLR